MRCTVLRSRWYQSGINTVLTVSVIAFHDKLVKASSKRSPASTSRPGSPRFLSPSECRTILEIIECLHFHPASRCTPETLPVVRRFPGPRVEEEPVGIPAVREVEQIVEASGLGVEGLIAYPAESPVILDKAQERGLVRDRVVHEILLGVRGDDQQGQPRTVAAAVLVRSRLLGLTAHPRSGEEIVLGVAGVVDDRPH